ncbi:hypothetical protein BSZ36_10805 [Rubricoccus marinus]|uniref:Sulfotransferase family protein n=2 Tax=Rubricoccus marinus TaxID=716817 RepID=A0A259U0G1_9BACT|nr:hypothetical protein BSZ36_10805 [Rubricoccus marinus]
MEEETLYWMKAAAVLEMEQPAMRYSRDVPYTRSRARAELEYLLRENVPGFSIPSDHEALVLDGWRALCEAYAPALFEKSPHHLHSRSALSLMRRASCELSDVEFRFVGLVRNPVDTLYSMWSRWRYVPEVREREWVRAYGNLLRFKDDMGDSLRVVRYEDIASDPAELDSLVAFALGVGQEPDSRLHTRSVQKWREDSRFGYQPSEAVLRMGERFGYDRPSMINPPRAGWAIYSNATRAFRVGQQALARLRGRVQ